MIHRWPSERCDDVEARHLEWTQRREVLARERELRAWAMVKEREREEDRKEPNKASEQLLALEGAETS